MPSMLQRLKRIKRQKQSTPEYMMAMTMQAGAETCRISLVVFSLLVLKDDVRKPHGQAWDTNNIDAMIVRGVPSEAIISPLLWVTFE